MRENLKLHVQELLKRNKISNLELEKELIKKLEVKYDEYLLATENEVTSFNKAISLLHINEDGTFFFKEEKKELSKEEKKKIRRFSKYNLIITTIIFLFISFIFNSWLTSWIIFLLSSFIEFIYRLFINRKNLSKKLYYTLSTILGFLSLFSILIVSFGIYIAKYDGSFEINAKNLQKEIKINKNQISKFEINLITSDLIIESYEGNEIIIGQYAQNKLPKKYLFSYQNNENLLIQENKAPVFLLTNYYHSIIKVTLPNNLLINELNLYGISSDFNIESSSLITNLEVESTSGNIKLENAINISNEKLKVLNGKIDINKIEVSNLDLNSTSGSIMLSSSKFEILKVISVSGRTNIDNVESHVCEISVDKSNILLNKLTSKLVVNNKTGLIKIVDPYFIDHSFINNDMGNIEFQFNSNNDYNFVLESKKGSIYNEYNSNHYGFVVSVTSNSGNINILILND